MKGVVETLRAQYPDHPVLHTVSRSQALWWPLHSVMATGPSIASMISAALMPVAGRASW